MDQYRYYTDPACDSLSTRILNTEENDGKWLIELEDTIFYPEGGGQPADRGTISGQEILDVQKSGDRILHCCAARPEAGDEGDVELNLYRSFRDHYCVQHTGQHLISSLLHKRGAATASVHLGQEECAIEVEGAELSPETLTEVEEAANREIRAARPVRAIWLERAEELASYDLRGSTDKTQKIRLVEIEGLDVNACGGLHVNNTAELGLIKFAGQEKKRGRQRLIFKIGEPAYRDYFRRFDELNRISTLLSTGPYDCAGRLEAVMNEKKEENRLIRLLTEKEAERTARELASSVCCYPPLLIKQVDSISPEFFRALVKYLSSEEDLSFLICARDGERLNWALHLPRHKALSFNEFKTRCLSLIDGRGGGRGPLWQGAGSRAEGADNFLAAFTELAGAEIPAGG